MVRDAVEVQGEATAPASTRRRVQVEEIGKTDVCEECE